MIGVFYDNLITFQKQMPGFPVTKDLWVEVVSKYLEQKDGNHDEAYYRKLINNAIIKNKESATKLYIDSVKYAASKGLRPGMTFLNGIPILVNSTSTFEETAKALITEEQELHLFDIVDSKLTMEE